MINRDIYFDHVRAYPFGGEMSQEQVDGQSFILDAWEAHAGDDDVRWLAYFLATAMHETASTMMPIEEYGKGQGYSYGKPDPVTGEVYYGRGYVQLTWADNYKRADAELGFHGKASCYHYPENALDPIQAARIGYRGMAQGWFRSPNTFAKYFSPSVDDPYGAREIINGDKKTVPKWSNGVPIGHLIEGYHDNFLAAIRAAWGEEPRVA